MNFLIARGQFIIITESQHDDNCNCDKQQKARNKSLLIINERRRTTRRDELLASGWMDGQCRRQQEHHQCSADLSHLISILANLSRLLDRTGCAPKVVKRVFTHLRSIGGHKLVPRCNIAIPIYIHVYSVPFHARSDDAERDHGDDNKSMYSAYC